MAENDPVGISRMKAERRTRLKIAVLADIHDNWAAMEQVAADLVRQGSVHGTLKRVPFSREAAVQEATEGYVEDPGPDIW